MNDAGLSARAYTKVLRVARTMADLAGKTAVEAEHFVGATTLRVLDRRIDAEAA